MHTSHMTCASLVLIFEPQIMQGMFLTLNGCVGRRLRIRAATGVGVTVAMVFAAWRVRGGVVFVVVVLTWRRERVRAETATAVATAATAFVLCTLARPFGRACVGVVTVPELKKRSIKLRLSVCTRQTGHVGFLKYNE